MTTLVEDILVWKIVQVDTFTNITFPALKFVFEVKANIMCDL
jgi:hypothetical protein